ncbi:hypothetical protein [Acinetobacter terrestris]|uniref:Uncharacterized protein n=1 Tax=Acinetobacter terrestris TaxID=2529843 RepID=A0AAW6UUS2_9GAMM|nr:hypothetical protein [Acinetobacter terrestris]MDK1684126.1 hypothetical protein [Acinetobacter terrestris]
MLLNNFFKSLVTMLNVAEASSEARAIAKMEITIARLKQAKPVRLFGKGDLE